MSNSFNCWKIPKSFNEKLDNREREFLKLELTGVRTPKNYSKRIKHLGFQDLNNVLDAGCGVGQWSITLAKNNNFVHAIDKNISRIKLAKQIADFNSVNNIKFSYGSLEKTSFPDNHFDAVFCYSVIMFTNIPLTLKEFYRVLKPGGRIYIMTDLQGWQRVLLNRSKNNLPIIMLMWIRKFFGKKSNIPFSKKWFYNQLDASGFKQIKSDIEGRATFNLSDSDTIEFYDSFYKGYQTLAEFIAEK